MIAIGGDARLSDLVRQSLKLLSSTLFTKYEPTGKPPMAEDEL